jgi:ribosome-binding protein aMBF1 (putative translation factor)
MSADREKVSSPRSAVLSQRPEYQRLGEWIRKARESKGLQQKPLSRALGKPEQFLNKVEQGRQRIDVVEFSDLLRELGCSIQDGLEALEHAGVNLGP